VLFVAVTYYCWAPSTGYHFIHILRHLRAGSLIRKFTRGYEDRYRSPLVSGTLVETCIAWLYSNQNIDKTATMLKFANMTTSVAVEESDLQFWTWLQKKTYCVRAYFYPPGPGYDVTLLYHPSRRHCLRAATGTPEQTTNKHLFNQGCTTSILADIF